MRSTPAIDARTGLEKLATYPYQIATWVDEPAIRSASRSTHDRPAQPSRHASRRRPA